MKLVQSIKILLLLLVLSYPVNLKAQDQADMMKIWQDYMTPSDIHKGMAMEAGEWKAMITQWMDPSQPPVKTEGTVKYEMILGGRYLQAKYNSTVMGMPMEGLNIIGYDNAKKLFHAYWIDNLGTGAMYGEGPIDEMTKTITIKGKVFDPMSKTDMDFRETFKMVDENHRLMELFMTVNGQEMKSLQVEFERK
jgi:hypothetical protein